MRPLQILLFFFSTYFPLQAQQSDKIVANLFERYGQLEAVNSIQMSGSFFKAFQSPETTNKNNTGIQAFRMIKNKEGAPNPMDQKTFQQLLAGLNADQYETLVETREEGTQLRFFVREPAPGKPSEAVILSWSPDSFLLISAKGLFKLEDLRNMDIQLSEN